MVYGQSIPNKKFSAIATNSTTPKPMVLQHLKLLLKPVLEGEIYTTAFAGGG
jgi:hypothetical protein